MSRKHFSLFLTFLWLCQVLYAQTPTERYKGLDRLLGEDSFFSNHMTGFMLYDLDEQIVPYEKNSHLYFIPASTTKLLTFYAGLIVLGDNTTALRYELLDNNEVVIWGTGDPSWAYPPLPQSPIKSFLSQFEKIHFSTDNWKDEAFGYGWQWDDYYYSYSAERSPIPIYGNLATIRNNNKKPYITPHLFSQSLRVSDKNTHNVLRDFHANQFYYNPRTFTQAESKVPFLTSPETFALLASEELKKNVVPLRKKLPEKHFELKGIPTHSLYKEMLRESDNFLAEQLLLMISDALFQELHVKKTIEHLKKEFLFDLPDAPQWVDGSGLSRHNLVTPRTMVSLVEKIYRILPDAMLFDLLPQGGINGTLKNSYRAPSPYIFAKTGTISNNHSLVGFIKTHQGKLYAFAFMNNNYPYKASQVRKEMEKVLLYIRDNF